MRIAATALLLTAISSTHAQAAISGSVFGPDGSAVAGARISAVRVLTLAERRTIAMAGQPLPVVASATTGDDGAFTLDTKTGSALVLHVERDGFAPRRELALDGEMATITLAHAAKRTGRVTANGKPVAGALVIAVENGGPVWTTRTDGEGAYAMADPGPWMNELAIVHPDFAPFLISTETRPKSLDAALATGARVSGRVLREGDRPAAKARVLAGAWSHAVANDDGTFVLPHVAADVEQLVAYDGAAFGSATRTAEPLVIRVEPRRSVSGTVRDSDGKPLAGVPVYAFQTGSEVAKWRDGQMGVSDDKGNYRLEHLDAVKHAVTAPDFSGREFPVVPASFASADAVRVDLTAKKEAALTGIVVDEQKRPVAGARMQLTMNGMPLLYGVAVQNETPVTRSGKDGRFRLPMPAVPDSAMEQLRLQAVHRRYAMGTAELGDRSDVVVVLPAGVELQGMVVDQSGRPVANAGIVALQDPSGSVPMPIDNALAGGMLQAIVESDAEGKFSIRVKAAPHDVGAWKSGYASVRAANVRPGGEPLKLVLRAPAEMRGRVLRNGAPVTSGKLLAINTDNSFETAVVQSDGTFAFTSLTAGEYRVTYGSEETGAGPEFSATAPASDLVFELPPTGRVRGRVVDAATRKPLAEYHVFAEGAEAVSEGGGEKSFELALPGGPAELTVSARGYMNATQHVIVETDKTVEVIIPAERGRELTGAVADEAGDPISEATINVEDDEGITSSEDNGSFLVTIPPRAATISVSATGFVEKKFNLTAGADDVRLNVVLSRGASARGRVVTSDGLPVGDAVVMAMGESMQQVKTGADGTFTISGLAGGLHELQARKHELESELVPVSDPSAAEIVLTMKPSPGAGSIRGVVKGFAEGKWMFGYVVSDGGAHAMVMRDGTFRFERIAVGSHELRVHATAGREQTASPEVHVEVQRDRESEVTLELRGDLAVRGTIFENGAPAAGRMIRFGSDAGLWTATSTADGSYAVTGVDPRGEYEVMVGSGSSEFHTTYRDTGTGTFDIRIDWASVEGRVIDEREAALSGADVTVETRGGRDTNRTDTDATGVFRMQVARGPRILTVEQPGYATFTQRIEAGAPPLLIRMQRTAGLRVRLHDAQTGAVLRGYAVAIDAAGLQIAKTDDVQADGAMLIPLGSGAYRIAVSSEGKATQSARITMPYDGELRFALTPGGTLIVNSDDAATGLVKLVFPSGEEYVRCHCNGVAEIRLTGKTTTIEHVAPGTYTMQVLDPNGRVKVSYPVTIAEGRTTTAEIRVPE